jgi:uncharacterized protein (DUF433 family)
MTLRRCSTTYSACRRTNGSSSQSRLLAQESSVISAEPGVMSGAPVFKGTRVLAQTLIEYLEAGDSIDDFLEGFPSVSREQVIAFLEETKSRVIAYAE